MRAVSLVVEYSWYLTTALQVAVVVMFVKRDLARRYWLFLAAVSISAAVSGVRIWALMQHHYSEIWHATVPFEMAVSQAMVAATYLLLASHTRRFRNFGIGLAAFLSVWSIFIVSASSGILHAPWPGRDWAILLMRYNDSACLLFLLGAWGFFAWMKMELRANMRKHLWLLTVLLAGSVVGNGCGYALNPTLTAVGLLLMSAAGVVAYAGWLRFEPAGEDWTLPPEATPDELREHDTEIRNLFDTLKDQRRDRKRYWQNFGSRGGQVGGGPPFVITVWPD